MFVQTTVVHCKRDPYDVYIGRRKDGGMHYGNPFSHNPAWGIHMPTREASIEAFRQWLNGTDHTDVEPERRRWILSNLHELEGKRLGCFCHPLACHGDVFANYFNRKR